MKGTAPKNKLEVSLALKQKDSLQKYTAFYYFIVTGYIFCDEVLIVLARYKLNIFFDMVFI